MNAYNFLKFLQDKKGKDIPLKFKILFTPESITDEDLTTEESLDLSFSELPSLPDNLNIGGSLLLRGSTLEQLPKNLRVGLSLSLPNTSIKELPDDLRVGFNLDIQLTPIKRIPYNLRIGNNFWIGGSKLDEYYADWEVAEMIKEKGGYIKGKVYTNERIRLS